MDGENNGKTLLIWDDLGVPIIFGNTKSDLGGGFKHFLYSPLFGEDSHFD